MWPPHQFQADAGGYPSWAAAPEADFPADLYAGSLPPPFAGAPMPPAFGDAAAANHLAASMKEQLQALAARVQKLERSRGQISKDINDMLSESREMHRQLGIDALGAEPVKAPLTPGLVEVSSSQDNATARRGSRTKTAPPSSLPKASEGDSAQPTLQKAVTETFLPPPGLAMPLPESLTVTETVVDGIARPRVEWRIDNAKVKFKDCVGRPLVSPPFEVCGLTDCRLMVAPSLGLDVTGLSMREQKSKYEARISEGPLSGMLKFKVVTSGGDDLVVKFSLFVGTVTKGPLEHNFADHIIHGVEFPNNWLNALQGAALVVGVEVLQVTPEPAGDTSQ
eukprot:TRINITY_DN38365_c0_g1_i1.p1 TRINITY_DN38365_c0_g1~~TRINITY_DN38365_c0_g1_i1.p1  ORF type:complete len:337 (-),score=71.85 TRINITY_DN38365_c0_g1_i1:118-1128(-)